MNQYTIDFRSEYNRHLRLARFKRKVAWLGVWICICMLSLSLGIAVACVAVDTLITAATLFTFVLWGLWGAHHLYTRH